MIWWPRKSSFFIGFPKMDMKNKMTNPAYYNNYDYEEKHLLLISAIKSNTI